MLSRAPFCLIFFFFNDTATTEIYTLSLHDALPISLFLRHTRRAPFRPGSPSSGRKPSLVVTGLPGRERSEEHTSELQSRLHLVCRLLLEKKKNYLYDVLFHHVYERQEATQRPHDHV